MNIFVLEPTLACLRAAARHCHGELDGQFDEVYGADQESVPRILNQLVLKPRDTTVIVMVPTANRVTEIQSSLRQLDLSNIKVQWFAPQRTVELHEICSGFNHVNLHQAPYWAELRGQNSLFSDQEINRYVSYLFSFHSFRHVAHKPFHNALQSIMRVEREGESAFVVPQEDRIPYQNYKNVGFPTFHGKSKVIRDYKNRIKKVAQTDLNVLIVGAPGTGRAATAFYIHDLNSRRTQPLLLTSCAGKNSAELETELFGQVSGSYPDEVATHRGLSALGKGSTLFIDDLEEMPQSVQVKLLRFIESGCYFPRGGNGHQEQRSDVRILVGLNSTSPTQSLRLDLYYRLGEMRIENPQLTLLKNDFNEIITEKVKELQTSTVNDETVQATIRYFLDGLNILREYTWPGNQTELTTYLKQRLFMNEDVLLDIAHQIQVQQTAQRKAISPEQHPTVALNQKRSEYWVAFSEINNPRAIRTLEELTTDYIQHVARYKKDLQLSQAALAEHLGISVNTLKKYNRRKEHVPPRTSNSARTKKHYRA